jgi:hypothetical protein
MERLIGDAGARREAARGRRAVGNAGFFAPTVLSDIPSMPRS